MILAIHIAAMRCAKCTLKESVGEKKRKEKEVEKEKKKGIGQQTVKRASIVSPIHPPHLIMQAENRPVILWRDTY